MSWDPEVKYAESGDVHIAYATIGDGPLDLVAVSPGVGSVDVDVPFLNNNLIRLAEFSRVVLYNPRGGGLSDPVSLDAVPTMEERMDDIRAVIDALGSERIVILGQGHGGPECVFFAGTYPDRVSSLILHDTYARWQRADDYPAGMPEEVSARLRAVGVKQWGSGTSIAFFLPSLARDSTAQRLWAKLERRGASPAQVDRMLQMWMATDVRDILPSIRVPTLVLHSAGDVQFRVDHGRYLADHIPGARYVEFSGADFQPQGDELELYAGEIEEFITGKRSTVTAERVLATVMFTDIVDSTRAASGMGDRAWRQLLDRHDEAVDRQLERFRGTAVKHTGDGVAATFDGPARAITCACAIRDAVRGLGLDIRAGLHTGEIERRGDDVSGVGVHIAARVAALAGAGEVLVSSTVKDLVVGSGIAFVDRGSHALKGVPDEWRLLAVSG